MTDAWIKKFQEEALPTLAREFKPEKVIIFGSRVRGTATKDSDIDVLVIAASFENTPF